MGKITSKKFDVNTHMHIEAAELDFIQLGGIMQKPTIKKERMMAQSVVVRCNGSVKVKAVLILDCDLPHCLEVTITEEMIVAMIFGGRERLAKKRVKLHATATTTTFGAESLPTYDLSFV